MQTHGSILSRYIHFNNPETFVLRESPTSQFPIEVVQVYEIKKVCSPQYALLKRHKKLKNLKIWSLSMHTNSKNQVLMKFVIKEKLVVKWSLIMYLIIPIYS